MDMQQVDCSRWRQLFNLSILYAFGGLLVVLFLFEGRTHDRSAFPPKAWRMGMLEIAVQILSIGMGSANVDNRHPVNSQRFDNINTNSYHYLYTVTMSVASLPSTSPLGDQITGGGGHLAEIMHTSDPLQPSDTATRRTATSIQSAYQPQWALQP